MRPLLLAMAFLPSLLLGQDLEPLFQKAEKDDAQLVALIEAASAPAARSQALCERLAPYARRLFFSPARPAGMERVGVSMHVVAKGENPTTIAKRYKVGAELLQIMNESFKPSSLKVGQELKVLDCAKTPLRLTVALDSYRLTAWRGDTFLVSFPVGLGAIDKPTPVGETTISLRTRYPEWTNPDTKEVIPGNDPRNLLGGYWLGFDPLDERTFAGIGIHGYTGDAAANWISKPGSHGCVRMLQDDIALVFALAIKGTKVSVRR